MESANLKIILHSGKGLRDVKHLGTMNPYAKIWISGDGMESKHITNTAKKGGSDPIWECSIDFRNVSMNKDYILSIKIKHDGRITDRKIGVVQVPFANLLTGDASGDRVSYWVTVPSGDKQGQIILSHEFSDITVRSGEEDGTSSNICKTSTSEVVGDRIKKKGGKAKRILKKAATSITTGAAEIAIGVAINELID